MVNKVDETHLVGLKEKNFDIVFLWGVVLFFFYPLSTPTLIKWNKLYHDKLQAGKNKACIVFSRNELALGL